MYYVNTEQIECRLEYLNVVAETLRILREETSMHHLVHRFAMERAIHIAAECITDIGSYLIDGFVMRDAASYEDIVDILFNEQVFSQQLIHLLSPLVKMRKPLVQNYFNLEHGDVVQLADQLPEGLELFSNDIRHYLSIELGS